MSAQLRELYLSQLERGSCQEPEHSAWPSPTPSFPALSPRIALPFHLHCFSPFGWVSERGFSPRGARWGRNPGPPWAVAALCLCHAGWRRARGWCWQDKGYLSWPVNGPATRSQRFTPVQCRDEPIRFVRQPPSTLSAGWRALTIFCSFRISIFIACLLPPGRGEKVKKSTASAGKFKHEHRRLPLAPSRIPRHSSHTQSPGTSELEQVRCLTAASFYTRGSRGHRVRCSPTPRS